MLIILNSSTADIRAQRPSVVWDQIWLIFVLISSEEDLITALSTVIPTDHASVSPLPHTPWWWSCVPSALPFALQLETRQLVVNTPCCWSWIRDSLLILKWQDLPHFDIRQNRDWYTVNEFFSSWRVHTDYAKRVSNTILVQSYS